MSLETALVRNSHRATWRGERLWESCLNEFSGLFKKEKDTGLIRPLVQQWTRAGEMSNAPGGLHFLSLHSHCRAAPAGP